MKSIVIFAGLALLVSCSNHQIHGAVRAHEQMECQKLPQNQYEECMAEVSETYESYSRKREEALSED